ncbi:MAG: hypothetical protein RAP03_10105 [Candidatus Electryonea clarkiae]|nr:hypothetical protein [Candidatus Electryonea clarkiae]
MKKAIFMVIITFRALEIFAGANCPNGAEKCHEQAIFERDILTGGMTQEQRECLLFFIPNHYDLGAYYTGDGGRSQLTAIGLHANSLVGAVVAVLPYYATIGLWGSLGWVDGTVGPASVGRVDRSEELFKSEFDNRVQYYNSLKGPEPYHLAQWNCKDYAFYYY